MTLLNYLRRALRLETSVVLGDRSYRLFQTNAPPSYDRLGTIEFRSLGNQRYVLVLADVAFYWCFAVNQAGYESAPSGAFGGREIRRTLRRPAGQV